MTFTPRRVALAPVGLVQHLSRDCDICGSEDNVRRYKIDFIDRPRRLSVDLCRVHGKPFEELASAIPATKGARPRVRKVIPKQEVQKKTPPKKRGPSS